MTEAEHKTIRDIPVVGRMVSKFDSMIGTHGLQGAMRELVRRSGGKLETSGLDPSVEDILRTKPVLLICNHPHDIETFALGAALPDREGLFFIGSHNLQGIGDNLAAHIIPVYIGKHEKGEGKQFKLSVRVGRRFKLGPDMSEEEAHQRNEQSIITAAEKIAQGHLVVIYPEGPKGKEGKWMDGIGYLLYHLCNTPDAQIVFAHVSGTSDKDILRLIPGASRFFPTVKVNFSTPMPARKIVGHLTAIDPTDKASVKSIAKGLARGQERDYSRWINEMDTSKQQEVYFKQIAAVIGPHKVGQEAPPVQFQLDPTQDNQAFLTGYRRALIISGMDMPKIDEEIQDIEEWLVLAKKEGKPFNIKIARGYRPRWLEGV